MQNAFSQLKSRLSRHHRYFAVWMLLSFLFVQTAGLLHAEVHHFHEHDESCDIYEEMFKPVDHVAKVLHVEPAYAVIGLAQEIISGLPFQSHIQHFYGRAPPKF